MTRSPLIAWMRRIGVQVVLLAFVSMALTGGTVYVLFEALRGQPDEQAAFVDLGGLLSTVRVLREIHDPSVRVGTLEASRRAFPRLDFGWLDQAPVAPDGRSVRRYGLPVDILKREMGGQANVVVLSGGGEEHETDTRVAIRIGDVGYLVARMPEPPPRQPVALVIGFAVFCAISLLLILPWTAWWIVRPLSRFSAAAADFSPDGEHEPLPETGAIEIGTAARALNRMRSRITDLVADRTKMLAAVGHDLRTPITRLRLRAEFVDDPELKGAILSDLDHMGAMVEGALAFIKSGRTSEETITLDLSALVQTIVDEYADLGVSIPLAAEERVMVRGREGELRRAIANLVDNALKYGKTARIALGTASGKACLDVIDDGPGIPPDRRAAMLQPFVRGDAARTLGSGATTDTGLGLGLAIAVGIAARHDGTLELDDAPEGGLLARLALPLVDETGDRKVQTCPPSNRYDL